MLSAAVIATTSIPLASGMIDRRENAILKLPSEPAVNGFWIYASPDNANGIRVEGGDHLKPGEHGRYERVNGEWTRAE